MDLEEATDRCETVVERVAESVVAEEEFLETVLSGILARGHVLLEDVPGTGKTLTARSFATALGLEFSRVQFTPDLLPADVTGTPVYREDEGFRFSEGPIFANVVLADEINRAPPKTQSALLEAMAERQVTVDGDTYELPDPFVVIATQNPVESEGVYELPTAQVDRFIAKTELGYPSGADERRMLRRRTERPTKTPEPGSALDPDTVRELQQVPETVTVHEDLVGYITDLSRATRGDHRVRVGVSPRGTQRLLEMARSHAVIAGREYVRPVDVQSVAVPTLAHRIVLEPDAAVDGASGAAVVESVLDSVPVPSVADPA